jgi:hypothetical protein
LAKNYSECIPGHGANRVTGTVKKRGENKGIAKAKKEQRRLDAIFRNSVTDKENRRKHRLSQKN